MSDMDDKKRVSGGVPAGGQFAAHSRADGEAVLPQAVKDPWGWAPPYPTTKLHLFDGAEDYAAVDQVWRANISDGDNPYDLRWGAVERGRELRRRGAKGVPTKLDADERLGGAQNFVELMDVWDLVSEEPPGDGELGPAAVQAFYARLYAAYDVREQELLKAGLPF
jgi:hypothetical protein